MSKTGTRTIIFITGAFVSHHCWDEWAAWFQTKGFNTIVVPWPHKEGTAVSLRGKHPSNNPGLASLTLSEILDHYTAIIRKCPEKPILVGHSLGGMMTQILVNRDLAAAGVALHPAPPQGIFPYEFSSIKSIIAAFGYFTSIRKTYMMSFKKWQYAFTNGMPPEQQRATYEQLTIPESKTVSRTAITSQAKVDFKKEHAPLLITAGSEDHILPEHLNRRNYRKYKQNSSVLDYRVEPGRNHFVLGLPTWKEDAEYVLNWINRHVPQPETAPAAAAAH